MVYWPYLGFRDVFAKIYFFMAARSAKKNGALDGRPETNGIYAKFLQNSQQTIFLTPIILKNGRKMTENDRKMIENHSIRILQKIGRIIREKVALFWNAPPFRTKNGRKIVP
jgi:hypothetical protein